MRDVSKLNFTISYILKSIEPKNSTEKKVLKVNLILLSDLKAQGRQIRRKTKSGIFKKFVTILKNNFLNTFSTHCTYRSDKAN